MYALKCLAVFLAVAGIGVVWFLYRRKVNQIMLVIALTVLIGGALRLFNMRDDQATVGTVLYALVVLVIVWGGAWVQRALPTEPPGAARMPAGPAHGASRSRTVRGVRQ